ncbi:hypothetical protein KALB_4172 [Kutzneria albida DSM 43870]|uniref:Dihydrolipoamide acetyltransferase component of pyruvate dehydrogenase complex n=2 Tax=Kutzneria TaxID=43356 RepID=W5WAF3_9PSEU|nr:hypothetical protein KALB_4172 [Kutzneria albida DSM 43870]
MPSLGADMDEGTLTQWLVKPGDTVRRGDVVAVIDTDKATVEVECFDSGVVERIMVPQGERVPVGTPLATITTEPAQLPQPAAPRPPCPPALASPPVREYAKQLGVDLASVSGTGRNGAITRADVRRAAPVVTPEPRGAPAAQVATPKAVEGGRTQVTPYARQLAKQLGVDLAALTSDSTGTPVRAAQVRAAATHQPSTSGEPTTQSPQEPDRLTAMRLATARLMARSKREIPHYYLSTEIDMTRVNALLRGRNLELPVEDRVLAAAALLKATAVTARRVPAFNGHWLDDQFAPGTAVHLGVAISLRGGGLIAPAIRSADELDLAELMRRLGDLVRRARSGRLRGTELTDATITVTNLGDLGVESVHGVIYPPQVALVGFGKLSERPCAVDGLLGVRSMVTATLSADHRATDGHTGARFLSTLNELLQRPEVL